MKKLIIVLFFLALITPVFAQTTSPENPASLYYVNVPVEKVIVTSTGYIIQYRTASNVLAIVGLPNSWFTDAASCAELLKLPSASDWPTMSIFYKDGKFSHVRLYVHPAKSHWTWGSVPMGTNVSSYFTDDPESFKIQY